MTKKLFVLGVVSASVFALVAGCGGGGGATADPVPPDTRKPVVTALWAKVLDGAVADMSLMTPGVVGVPNRAIFVAEIDEVTQGCPTSAPVSGTFGDIAGSLVCVKGASGTTSVWTLVPSAPLGDGARITLTLTPTDVAGNRGELKTTFQAAFALATVTLSATPTTVVAGSSATLTWTTTNASNCLATGGWNGSLVSTGGSQVVTPTATTTYSAVCYNSANVATPVVSTTVTVTPKPVVTYPAAVVVFGANWFHRVDPTAPQGIAPITNNTGREFYSYGFRATALPNCQIQVSGLDNYTFAPLQVFWDRKKAETTLDTSGTAPPRLVGNYIFAVLPDPNFPGETMSLTVGDERYFVLDVDHRTLWYQRGTAPAVALGTYPIGIHAVIAYPACTVQ